MAEAELKLVRNDMDGAIAALEEGITKVKIAPQCCMKLANLSLERGEFAKAETCAKQGIVATAQDQPTASIAYLYYLLALSMDAQRQEAYLKNAEYDISEIGKIIRYYETADTLFVMEGRGDVGYRRTIQQKLFILKEEGGAKLEKE